MSGTYVARWRFARSGLPEDGLRAPLELRLLRRLLRERLHDVDADDVLLGDGRDVGELLLHVAQRRVRDVAVAIGERDEDRRDREHDQREPPLEEEEDDRHRHDGEHVLEEEDQPVAEEEADALQVDGRARHQLAGLVAVVEAEGEPHEVRVEAAAHVHLDVERLAAGDQAPAGHERGAHDAEADDRDDRDPEPARSCGSARRSITSRPVIQTSAIWAACEPTARTIETTSATRYGRRKPSRRTNVAPIRDGAHLGSGIALPVP